MRISSALLDNIACVTPTDERARTKLRQKGDHDAFAENDLPSPARAYDATEALSTKELAFTLLRTMPGATADELRQRMAKRGVVVSAKAVTLALVKLARAGRVERSRARRPKGLGLVNNVYVWRVR